jgi:hypothetical protein
MMEQASDSPGYGFGYAAASAPPPSPAPPPAMYELRPLSTGEILDRTFSLYRRRFWLYCGLSALAAAFSTLLQLIRLTLLGGPPRLGAAQAPRALVLGGAATLATVLLYLLAYAITQAATISAVSSVYLGHETSMGKALKVVRQKWWRYILIALWQGWSAVWVFLLLFFPAVILMGLRVGGLETLGVMLIFLSLAALAYGVVAYIRNSLAVPASVFEGLKVRAAMRRSKALAAGRKGSIFLLMILLYVLSLVAGMLQGPFVLLLTSSDAGKRFMAQGLSLAVVFVSNSLIGPVGAIALCLFYIDQRVRKEGFDIEALMDPTLGSGVPKPPAPPVELLPSGFAPSGFTAAPAASPFAPSGFTAASSPFPPSQFTAPPAAAPPPPPQQASEVPFPPSGFAQAQAAAPALESTTGENAGAEEHDG